MPALAYHFGILPWQVADLTYGEIEEFMLALKELSKPPKGSR